MLSVAELERIQRSRKVKEQWPLHLVITVVLLLLPIIALIVAASEEGSTCQREDTICSDTCIRKWEELVATLTEEERVDLGSEEEEYSTRCQGECDATFTECSEKPLILYIGVAVLSVCSVCTCLLASLTAALRREEEVERITRSLEGGEETDMVPYSRRADKDDTNITAPPPSASVPGNDTNDEYDTIAAIPGPSPAAGRHRGNLSNLHVAQESLGSKKAGSHLIKVECPNCGGIFRSKDMYTITASQALFCPKCEYMIAGIL